MGHRHLIRVAKGVGEGGLLACSVESGTYAVGVAVVVAVMVVWFEELYC